MKALSKFLLLALSLVAAPAYASPVATTVGSNLTAYNPNGSINNNNWNNLTNVRSMSASANAPTADFGNCNAIIMRCAQPKCANGGCSSLDLARPIVSGCVQSNENCKQYGNDLIEYISAQLVANSTAKANQQALQAQTAAAQAAAQQSAQQMQQMQAQMQQMQEQMAQQNAQANAQLQAALEQQKELTAQAIAQASANQTPSQTIYVQSGSSSASAPVTTSQQATIDAGVSADLLAREQISGQILSALENAETSLIEVESVLKDVYNYAGCDSKGNNCTGPKRVKVFKQKAMNFFDPYNGVLDEVYDALILAQSVGVDITDIYMMLNGTCNAWAQYLCGPGQVMHYTQTNCVNGKSVPAQNAGDTGTVLGGAKCKVGQVVPMSDGGCQLVRMLTDKEDVQKSWLYPEIGSDENVQVRVGCASEALDNSLLFASRKKQASIDIETLQRIIEQDAPSVYGNSLFGGDTTPEKDGVIYCAVNSDSLAELQKSVALKRLPDDVCVPQSKLAYLAGQGSSLATADESVDNSVSYVCGNLMGYEYAKCACQNSVDKNFTNWNADAKKCECLLEDYPTFDLETARCIDSKGSTKSNTTYFESTDMYSYRMDLCTSYSGKWDFNKKSCDCSNISDFSKKLKCQTDFMSFVSTTSNMSFTPTTFKTSLF